MNDDKDNFFVFEVFALPHDNLPINYTPLQPKAKAYDNIMHIVFHNDFLYLLAVEGLSIFSLIGS